MLKKFLMVSVVSILLVGCGKKEVTEEMLIGHWSCNVESRLIAYDKDDVLENIYQTAPSIESIRFSRNEQGGFLMTLENQDSSLLQFLMPDNHDRQPFAFDFKVKSIGELKKWRSGSGELKGETKTDSEFIFISNDQYNMKLKKTMISNLPFNSYTKVKTEYEQDMLCNRVAN